MATEDPFRVPASPALVPVTNGDHEASTSRMLGADDGEGEHVELPDAPALSHELFLKDGFDTSEFLLTRRHTPLDELRSDLRAYFSTLRASLIQVINEDYEDFIGLSLGLRRARVAPSLKVLKGPVLSVHTSVQQVKAELEGMKREMGEVLDQREAVRLEKARLRGLLAVEDQLGKVEEGLALGESIRKDGPKPRRRSSLDATIDSPPKRLERLALEYSQLKYLTAKASTSTLSTPFLQSLEPRIELVTSTLLSDLSQLLHATLTEARRSASPGRSGTLLTLFRIHASLAQIPQAEKTFREAIVLPFVSSTITRDALNASAAVSPNVLPRTPPLESALASVGLDRTRSQGPKLELISLPTAEGEDPAGGGHDASKLVGLYNRILSFIETDCLEVSEIAQRSTEHISPSSGLSKGATLTAKLQKAAKAKEPEAVADEDEESDATEYDLITRVVWAEVAKAVTEQLGTTVFAAGRPNVFHQNFTTTQLFLARLSALSPSLGPSETTVTFRKRFPLSVYYQLRFSELAGRVERELVNGEIAGGVATASPSDWAMRETREVWIAIGQCWSEKVWIPELAGRFFGLVLQIISRYRTWVNSVVPAYVPPSSGGGLSSNLSSTNLAAMASEGRPRSSFDAPRDRLTPSAPTPRPGTPVGGGAGQSDEQIEEQTLKNLAMLVADCEKFEARLLELWHEVGESRVPKGSEDSDEASTAALNEIVAGSVSPLSALLPGLSTTVTSILVRRCAEPLASVGRVASLVRASTRGAPQEPSYFVSSILKTLRKYMEGPGGFVGQDRRDKWAQEVSSEVAVRYARILIEQRKTDERLLKLKKGRQGFSFFNRVASGPAPTEEDDGKVTLQMQLDVTALEEDAKSLGVDTSSEAWEGLRSAVVGDAAAQK